MICLLQGICQLMTFYANKIEQRAQNVNFFAEGEERYVLNPQVSCMDVCSQSQEDPDQ